MAEFILEDGKLVTDGIPTEKIPTDMNLRTVNHLKVTTDPRPFSTRDSPADTANTSVKLQLQGWTEKIEKGAVGTLVSKIKIIYFIRIHEKITEGKVAAVHLADPLIRPGAYSVS